MVIMLKNLIKYHWLLLSISGLTIWIVWSTCNDIRVRELNEELDRTALNMTDESYDEIKRLLDAGADVNYKIKSVRCCGWCGVGGIYSAGEYKVGFEQNESGFGDSSLLMVAVDRRCDKIVHMLVEEGAILECNGFTAMHVAAQNGDMDLVKYFLSLGCDVDGECDATPLLLAAEYGHKEIVDLLIEKGANVNTVCVDNHSALYYAAQNGHIEIVKTLIDKGADVNLLSKDEVSTAILAALYKGQTEVVKLLLEVGADIHLSHKLSYDPLFAAIRSCKPEMVELVLNYEPDLDVEYFNGMTCLDCAINSKNADILKLIIEAKGIDRDSELWKAIDDGRSDKVKAYIAAGADVNSFNKIAEKTPLMLAVEQGGTNCIKELLEAGADVNFMREKDGATALTVAIKREAFVLEELLKAGAEIPQELIEKYKKKKSIDGYDKYVIEQFGKYIN